jgi:tRNA-dihydrouridine synthase B
MLPESLQGNPLLILAPMSGVTDLPFRRCLRQQGGASLVVSEMIASASMVHGNAKTLRRSSKSLDEYPFAIQLAGCDPHLMAEAARICQDQGATLIDLNFGCPAKKIAINSYAGSALMQDEVLSGKIFQAVKKAVNLPVTVKMRKGWDSTSENAGSLAKIAWECGLSWVTIHGRTRCQFYHGTADWDFIAKVRSQVPIPIMVNGDIKTEEDALKALQVTKAAGAMIGRGCYGKPWFLNQVDHFLKTGEKKPAPPIKDQQNIILSHFEETLSHYGKEGGVSIFRKHLGWYSKGLKDATAFRAAAFQENEPLQIISKIKDFFQVKNNLEY